MEETKKTKRRKDESLVEACRTLYLNDWSQSKICEAFGVSTAVLSRWKKEDGWEEQRIAQQVSPTKLRDMAQFIAEYQMEAVYSEVKKNKEAGVFTPLPNGTLDGLHKLSLLLTQEVKNKRAYLVIMDEFRDYLMGENFDLVKAVVPYVERFTAIKVKESNG